MDNPIRLSALAMGLTMGAVAAPLLAGNPAPKVPDGPTIYFTTADRNGDGSISRQEALLVPDLTSAFEMLDADRDDMISPTEFSRWNRAAKTEPPTPRDPATAPSGSAGSQHMPKVE
jgi:hypothetical protein